MGRTSLNLETGLTVLTGTVGSGKTEVLMGLAKEFHEEGIKTVFMSAEGETGCFHKRFGDIPFDCIDIRGLDSIDTLMNAAHPNGDAALLVDGFDLLPAPAVDQIASLSKALHDFAHRARNKGIYLVFTIQEKRGGGFAMRASGALHYPVIRLKE